MSPDNPTDRSDVESLSPKTITSEINNVDAGDNIRLNNHEEAYEVVDTNTYTIIVKDTSGRHMTVSQNLQTGGWTISEEIFYVESV